MTLVSKGPHRQKNLPISVRPPIAGEERFDVLTILSGVEGLPD